MTNDGKEEEGKKTKKFKQTGGRGGGRSDGPWTLDGRLVGRVHKLGKGRRRPRLVEKGTLEVQGSPGPRTLFLRRSPRL